MENKRCVLVVDDQPMNVRLLATQLEAVGYEVVKAYDGQEAIEFAGKHMPDIVLLDIMMPGIDGYETCRRMKADPVTASIPVIFISALTDINEKVNAFKCGGVDYICKPFQREEVLSRVDTHLKLYSLQRSLAEQNIYLEEAKKDLLILNRRLKERVEEEVSKRQSGEQMLVQQSKMAAMGEMLSMIAHQWKQPLNAISSTAQDLEDAYIHNELDKAYLHTSVAAITNQTDFMLRTADDFRNFLRPSKEKTLFSIKEAIEQVVLMFSPYFVKSDISLNFNHTGDDFGVTGYPNEFKQVILNLISNARDAILSHRDKQSTNIIDINVIKAKDGGMAVTIRDTGGGIPEDLIGRIFDPYFTTKDSDKGTGIGLYMSRTIIEANMGWRLTVSNIEGGAEFRIDI